MLLRAQTELSIACASKPGDRGTDRTRYWRPRGIDRAPPLIFSRPRDYAHTWRSPPTRPFWPWPSWWARPLSCASCRSQGMQTSRSLRRVPWTDFAVVEDLSVFSRVGPQMHVLILISFSFSFCLFLWETSSSPPSWDAFPGLASEEGAGLRRGAACTRMMLGHLRTQGRQMRRSPLPRQSSRYP